MKLFFVGEGTSDELVVPIIVNRNGLQCEQSEFKKWKDLRQHRGRGFGKKLTLALALARQSGKQGLVATLDADDQRDRLKILHKARNKDRENTSNTPMPVALGQAIPELEAWLLDDHEAVKQGLSLSAQTDVAHPGSVPDVKIALNLLMASSTKKEEGRASLLAAIAEKVTVKSSRNPNATGLKAFIKDVSAEYS